MVGCLQFYSDTCTNWYAKKGLGTVLLMNDFAHIAFSLGLQTFYEIKFSDILAYVLLYFITLYYTILTLYYTLSFQSKSINLFCSMD